MAWFCFCFVFVRSHAPCGCCSIACLRFQVVKIKQVDCKMSTKNANNITIMFILRALLSFEAHGFWFTTWQFHLCPTQNGRLKRHWGWQIKSESLKWQQCPTEWTLLLLLISYDYSGVDHYTTRNGEKMKTM